MFLMKICALNPHAHRLCMSQISLDVFISFWNYQFLNILKDERLAMPIPVYLWLYWNDLWQLKLSSRASLCLRVFVPFCSYIERMISKVMNR